MDEASKAEVKKNAPFCCYTGHTPMQFSKAMCTQKTSIVEPHIFITPLLRCTQHSAIGATKDHLISEANYVGDRSYDTTMLQQY
jgi:hypothetical protein